MASPVPLLFSLLVAAQSDSVATRRWAEGAQDAFEWRRGLLAPRTLGGHGSPCDERIGRFCYWFDEDVDTSPPEPETIAAARDRLLVVLDSAAARLPGDEWIAGQRVRYLVESKRPADALAAARDCRAAPWWCEALEGFARHTAGDEPGADSDYTEAVAAMPAAERCRWSDLTALLEGDLRARFSRLGCAEREAMAAHLWWLAQPLYSQTGNDRRVEHFARLTMARMLDHAGSAWSEPVGDDLRELTVRYGWPVGWSEDATFGAEGRTIVGHDRQPAFHFFPDLGQGTAAGTWTWTLKPPRPRERYAPINVGAFESLDPDITVFRRGESTLVVVAYDLTRDTLWGGESLATAAVLARDEATPPMVVRDSAADHRGVLVAMAPWQATLAGFEVTQDEAHHAGRARLAVPAWDSSRVQVSDPLVFEATDSLPQDLAAVLPLVRGPARVPRGTRIGIYWETYGAAASEPIETAVHVTRLGTGLLRRVGAWLRLGHPLRETRLAWRETVQPVRGVSGRAVTLDVASLDPGRYRIAVSVAAGGHTVSASRQLEIVAP